MGGGGGGMGGGGGGVVAGVADGDAVVRSAWEAASTGEAAGLAVSGVGETTM